MNARKKIRLIFLIFLTYLSFFCLNPKITLAKKKIGAKTSTVKSAVPSSLKMVIRPKLRSDRKALQVTFSNLNYVTSFTYELIYEANGIDQGAYGSVTIKDESPISRELLFGTCSGTVCRYHTGIKNMKFSVTTTYKNGRKIINRYRVKP